MEFTRPRGTRDFLPEEIKKRRKVEGIIRDTFEKFGFCEVVTPTFENLELITAKSGDEIRQGLYHFRDKSDRDLTLRPELTAPVMRLYVNEMQKRPKPVKLYYIANCFRYERSQKGRFREFWQAGVESIGSANPEADAEVIALAVKMLENLGLENFKTHIGHIGILRGILKEEGVSESEQNTLMGIIDKGERAQLEEALEKFSSESRQMLLQIIELEGSPTDVLDKVSELLKGKENLKNKISQLIETLDILDSFGARDYEVNLGIARGLDYYTGIVFEIYAEKLGAQDQICGGGNYTLTDAFGGEKTATSGFAFGFDRVMLALEAQGALKEEDASIKYLVVPTGNEMIKKAIEISTLLRRESQCEVDLMRRKLGKALTYANTRGMPFVVIVGEEEIGRGKVLIRNMGTGEQSEVDIKDLK
jgi:histidyl-tRNA synthetase